MSSSYHEDEYNSVSWDTPATDILQSRSFLNESDDIADDTEQSTYANTNTDSMYTSFTAPAPSLAKHTSPLTTTTAAYPMTITVTDPLNELDGTRDTFVSYLITTDTTLETFEKPTVSVRRRFQDFVLLYNTLTRDFPACVVPPLPDKHRLEYITGDRFSAEFKERRRASLQRLLNRLARHPTLQRSEYFRIFLESREWNAESLYRQKRISEGVFDNLGDVLMNAFVKIKKPDGRFIEIKENIDKLEENLQTIERLYQRIVKRQSDLEADYEDFGNSVVGLSQLETGISDHLNKFANVLSKFSVALRHLRVGEEQDYLHQIRDFLSYCHCVKNVLKLRDQKQVDFEDLSDHLQQATTEREVLINTGKGGTGIGSFLRETVDNIKGVDAEKAKQERLVKLESRINELSREVDSSHDESNGFSEEVVKEYEIFSQSKADEMKEYLLAYTDSHVEFFKEGKEMWESLIPILESIRVHV
ncbi:1756_t:CDS:10 [Paraglomus occultum]|uniref:Sorting nexin-4 n=1 Tax=Paraglomus occultum TaxID=144539 RepID=A0A9N8WBT4_9GLOM|nr:1756_t:CDS:10 [Paraglomus occultum]